jgi:hypothetical protein
MKDYASLYLSQIPYLSKTVTSPKKFHHKNMNATASIRTKATKKTM